MGKHFTLDFVKQRVREISDCELLATEYVDNRTKMPFRCRCGNIFETNLNKFQNDNRRQCTACAKKAQYAEKRWTRPELDEKLATFGCKYVSGEYVNQKSIIRILCRCGHERDLRINSMANRRYPFTGLCSECAAAEANQRQALTVTEVAVLARAFDLELLSDEYHNAQEKLRFKCRCGREFEARWNNVQQGQNRCWACSKRVSKGEYAVSKWLDEHGIAYVPQKKFLDCGGKRPYPFDFFLPDDYICIEFDGEQHTRPEAFMGGEKSFEEIKARDQAKNAYCAAHDIILLRIPHTDYKRIPEILSSMVIPR